MESEIYITEIRNTSLEEILKIIQIYFPEYETVIVSNCVLLRKSIFVHVKVSLMITSNGCKIGLDGTMSPIAKYLFGGYPFHYVFRGSLLEDIADCIKKELNKEK